MDFVPGVIVAGRFRLARIVGSGGMGEVWAADDQETGARVALKRLLPAAAKHHEVVARFKREAFLLGRVKSDYVARVIDFVEDETFGLLLVMEFIEGPSLAHILEDRTLTVEEAVDLAVDLLHALCDLHEAKIVHRDLKPGNIIMRPLPGRARAVIVDFGISRLLASEGEEVTGITRANIALGTVEYMAPEQILSSRDVTPITDLYAVGIILFRAVKGHHAFGDRRGEELARAKLIEEAPPLETGRNDEIALGLSALVARALKKRPAQRYASAKDMLNEALELEFKVQRADDLDDTTSDDSGSTVVRRSPLADAQASAAGPPIPPAPASMPIASPRGSLPSIPEHAGHVAPPNPRSSMPSIPDGMGPPLPRGSFASIPDGVHAVAGPPLPLASDRARPPPPPEPLTGTLDRGGVPKGTVALAVLTAFAVGAAVGLVLAPTSAPAGKAPEPSACPPCRSAAVVSAAAPSPPPSVPVDPEPSASASSSATPRAKPALSGKLPPRSSAPAAKPIAAPSAPPAPTSAPKAAPDPGGEEPDAFIP